VSQLRPLASALYSLGARALASARSAQARARQARAVRVAAIDPTAVLYREAGLDNLGTRPDAIRIGAHTHVRGRLLIFAHGGNIEIGEWCYVGEATRIWSAASIRVGSRVLISHGCEIHDCNAHSTSASARHRHFREMCETGHPTALPDVSANPIVIEDDAWVGFGATILKGVRVGAKSIVAARAVVTEDVPPGTIVAGFPARVVRELTPEECA
jgi:acetyltransferase-like isoleucine patch superfamily enzyme